MKANLLLFVLPAILLSGCAQMAVNRAANDALKDEVHQVALAQNAKFATAKPILIVGHNARTPNSAGGVDVSVCFQNTSGKVIKYAYFSVTGFNRVGDEDTCRVRHDSKYKLVATGPFDAAFCGELRWECIWYNNTINFARIDSVRIEYMDGTSEEVSGEKLATIQVRPENNIFSSGIQQTRRVFIQGGSVYISTFL